MRELTPEQKIFQRMVETYDESPAWTGSRAQGLFEALVILTGEEDTVMEQLHEALQERRQRAHEEYLDSLGAE